MSEDNKPAVEETEATTPSEEVVEAIEHKQLPKSNDRSY